MVESRSSNGPLQVQRVNESQLVHVVAELEHEPGEDHGEAAHEHDDVEDAQVTLVVGLARHVDAESRPSGLTSAQNHLSK